MLSRNIKQAITQNDYEVDKKLGFETGISIFYIKEKVCKKYPKLKLVKINCYHEVLEGAYQDYTIVKRDIGLYAFIEKNKIKELPFTNLRDQIPRININNLCDQENIIQTRKEILKECSIVVQRTTINSYDMEAVSIYPVQKDYYARSILENTKLLLASVSNKINQEELDNLCFEILNSVETEVKNNIDNRINLLKSIKEKVIKNEVLTKEETKILNNLIHDDILKAKSNTSILKYTLERKY